MNITVFASYTKKDGSVSKYPQSWTAAIRQHGKVVRLIEGCGTKKQAVQMASKIVNRVSGFVHTY
jgi:hypothetical protein